MRVLIPGAAGTLSSRVARTLAKRGHEVIGIDVRPWIEPPVEFYQVDIRKRAAEDVFRRRRPDAVIHMATVNALAAGTEERERINLGGTQAVFEHCRKWGVKQMVFVGRHTYYGAAPDAPLYHTEDEPPRALDEFPELADLVAADLYAATALWRIPELTTSVLRICYTLGTRRSGALATYLSGRRVPTILGHDPLFQFMHEEDVVTAIVLALEKKLRGVFNVAGPAPVPLSLLIRKAGRTPVPVPRPLLQRLLGRRGFPRLPPGALGHLKYPVVIDSNAFRRATDFQHAWDEVKTVEAFRTAQPPRVRT
ncbi:MAG: SDR family oxidoreductase [Myxococcaceae bacterium]